jgi:hypothetical protein
MMVNADGEAAVKPPPTLFNIYYHNKPASTWWRERSDWNSEKFHHSNHKFCHVDMNPANNFPLGGFHVHFGPCKMGPRFKEIKGNNVGDYSTFPPSPLVF